MTEEPDTGSGAEADKAYSTEQFAFVDDNFDATDDLEASHWLSFMNSRAGRRVDRRERARERVTILAVVLALVVVAGGVVLWSPWSSAEKADTGHDVMPADQVAVLFQVQAANSTATTSAILVHDRRSGGRSALVNVPPDLVIPVEGEGRLTVRQALADAGPTLSREALSELLGVNLSGSWVLDATGFSLLVDRLGGLRVGGQALTGAQALARVGATGGGQDVLPAFLSAFPTAYTVGRDLLTDVGILAAPGLPVDLLGAVVTGISRDDAAGKLKLAALPLDSSGHMLDLSAALPVVRDLLGGQPGRTNPDATPRILVRIVKGSGYQESDVRADVLNAGYEYVDGGTIAGGASQVVVRPSTPDARAIGASIAITLGLPESAVRLSDDVPFTADVLVVLGKS
jgi:hypothetical protein